METYGYIEKTISFSSQFMTVIPQVLPGGLKPSFCLKQILRSLKNVAVITAEVEGVKIFTVGQVFQLHCRVQFSKYWQ